MLSGIPLEDPVHRGAVGFPEMVEVDEEVVELVERFSVLIFGFGEGFPVRTIKAVREAAEKFGGRPVHFPMSIIDRRVDQTRSATGSDHPVAPTSHRGGGRGDGGVSQPVIQPIQQPDQQTVPTGRKSVSSVGDPDLGQQAAVPVKVDPPFSPGIGLGQETDEVILFQTEGGGGMLVEPATPRPVASAIS